MNSRAISSRRCWRGAGSRLRWTFEARRSSSAMRRASPSRRWYRPSSSAFLRESSPTKPRTRRAPRSRTRTASSPRPPLTKSSACSRSRRSRRARRPAGTKTSTAGRFPFAADPPDPLAGPRASRIGETRSARRDASSSTTSGGSVASRRGTSSGRGREKIPADAPIARGRKPSRAPTSITRGVAIGTSPAPIAAPVVAVVPASRARTAAASLALAAARTS